MPAGMIQTSALSSKARNADASVSGLQLVALIYYVASYFPGGTQGVKFVMMMATSAVKQCMFGVRQAVFGS